MIITSSFDVREGKKNKKMGGLWGSWGARVVRTERGTRESSSRQHEIVTGEIVVLSSESVETRSSVICLRICFSPVSRQR